MDKLWTVAIKDIRTRFTDRRLLVIMVAAPLAIATIIGLAFGGLGRASSPVNHIPVAVINHDQPLTNGTDYGSMLAVLLTTGQLPSGTNTSLSTCPQSINDTGDTAGSIDMSLGELISGTSLDETQASNLVSGRKIDPLQISADDPNYL
jgi:hypothetical protein